MDQVKTVKNVVDSLKETSEKLLQGWTMLDMCCPISNYPLIEKDGVIFSVPCQMEVVVEGNKNFAKKENNATMVTNTRAVFRLLRLGFVMSAEKCPLSGGPMFVKGKQKFSLELNRLISDDTDEQDLRTAVEERDADMTNSASNEALDSDLGERVVNSQTNLEEAAISGLSDSADYFELRMKVYETFKAEWTKSASQKLLQGWTMLNESCPVTNAVPLMQNSDGRKYSPAIGQFVDELTQEEAMQISNDMLQK